MHELSIIASLFEALESQAREHKADRITRVVLRVGPLSGAVPELLREAFDVYKKDTLAGTAEIEIIEPPVRVRCKACGAETEAREFIFKCSSCDSTDISLASGTELYLERIELETD
jgi:hydrogenase nickel incorporation protein HypA/HybF